MITPFNKTGEVDYNSLIKLTKWYEKGGANGLFAICQSSEIFKLTLDEKINITKTILNNTKLPVVASGNTQDTLKEQLHDLNEIAKTGVDAVVLLTNMFVKENESDEVFITNLQKFLDEFDKNIPLGLYECPYPYKRLITKKTLEYILSTKRFIFLKDTSCNINTIKERLDIIKNSDFGLYNANAQTLIESLKYGAKGYSGIHANFSIKLAKYIYDNYNKNNKKLNEAINLILDIDKLAVENMYPVCAKEIQKENKIFNTIITRVRDYTLFDEQNREQCINIHNKILEFEVEL